MGFIIALSTVDEQTLIIQIIVVSFIAILATVGVYGFVAWYPLGINNRFCSWYYCINTGKDVYQD